MRIGQGFDVHRLGVEGSAESIRLGGVDVPYSRELIAHSDGDVVIHALCDAMLGALALGDIGRHFSDKDPAYKNIDSLVLLGETNSMITEKGYAIVNADITVIAEAPRMSPFVTSMCERLADVLGCPADRVSVKATTTEKVGFIGRGEAIAAQAVVLVKDV